MTAHTINEYWKPCPFCGISSLVGDGIRVKCTYCGAEAPEKMWNRRAELKDLEDELLKHEVKEERYKTALEQIAEAIK